MQLDIITKEDLLIFRQELLQDLLRAIGDRKDTSARRFIKSGEARALLDISSNTLNSMVINGRLHRSKLGGVWYYDINEITNVLSQRK